MNSKNSAYSDLGILKGLLTLVVLAASLAWYTTFGFATWLWLEWRKEPSGERSIAVLVWAVIWSIGVLYVTLSVVHFVALKAAHW